MSTMGRRSLKVGLAVFAAGALIAGFLISRRSRIEPRPSLARAEQRDAPRNPAAPWHAPAPVTPQVTPPAPGTVVPEERESWTVVAPENRAGVLPQIVWSGQRGDWEATLDDHGMIAFMRKLKTGEDAHALPAEVMAEQRALDAEAKAFALAHLPTISPEESEEREAAKQAAREAADQAAREAAEQAAQAAAEQARARREPEGPMNASISISPTTE